MPNIKISDLPVAALPLDGAATFFEVQAVEAGIQVSRKVSVDDFVSGGIGLDATFVTVTGNAVLPNERVLTAGTNVGLVDAGAGNPITINVTMALADLTDVVLAGVADNDLLYRSVGNWIDTAGLFTFDGTDIGHVKFGTQVTGVQIRGALNNDPSTGGVQDATIELANVGLQVASEVGFADGDANFRITNLVDSGHLLFSGTDAAGNEEFAFLWDPDAGFWLRHGVTSEIVIASVTVATGGILVANGVTGAGGNSRVRTTSDKGALEIEYNFDTNTDTGSDPGGQDFRMNNVNPALVTEIAVADQSIASQSEFNLFWGAELVSGDKLFIVQPNSQDNWAIYELTGVPVDQGVFWNFPVSLIANGTIFDTTRLCRFSFSLANLSTGGFDPTANQTITGDWTFDNALFDLKLGVSTSLHFRNNADDSNTFVQNLGPTLQFGIAGADFGSGIFEIAQSSWAKVVCPPLFVGEQAAAEADVAGDGQFWVRNDVPNTPMFTDDAGNDFILNSTLSGTQLVDPAANVAVIAEGLGVIGVRSVGNTDAEERDLEWQYQDGTTRASIGNEFFTDFIFRNHITGRHIIFQVGVGAGNRIRLHLNGDQTTGGVSLYAGTSGSPVFQTDVKGCHMSRGTLFIDEQAAQEADVVGQGQLWIRDDTPNVLIFRDDAGNNSVLSTNLDGLGLFLQNFGGGTEIFGISATGAGGIDLDFTNVSVVNFNGGDVYDFSNELIRSVSTLQMQERAAANGDIAGQGQLWIEDLVANTLMFTDDTGIDMRVSCVQWFNNFGGQQTVNNSVTPVVITQLSGFQLDANSVYHIEIFLKVNQASATPDLLLRLASATGTFTDEVFQITSIAATGVFTFQDTNVHTVLGAIQNATGNHIVHIIGTVDVGAGDTWDLEFAQQIATVANTIIDDASYVKVTKIGPGP